MKRRNLFLVILSMIFVLSLSACGKAKTEDQNAYRLPLGDPGYTTELNLYLNNKYEIPSEEEGQDPRVVNYKYLEHNKSYTLELEMSLDADAKATEKCVVVSAIMPGEGETSSVIFADQVYWITKAQTTYTINFSSLPEGEDRDIAYVTLVLGTSADEEHYFEKHPEATKKEYKNHIKSVKGSKIRISNANLSDGDAEHDLLVETDTNNLPVYKKNENLTYYNTATINYDITNALLTVTLNSKTGAWQWVVEMLGKVLAIFVKGCKNKYWVGILIFTLLLRTLAWPIYAKSNSYSSNMAKVQPELERIQKKYEGRTDQNSKMKQQMETREVMKKNKVSILGCLTPFLQMPIFIAVYQVVSRFPLTPKYAGFDYSFGNTSFAMTYGKAESSVLLAVFVGVTMIASQLLSMYFTKLTQKKHQNFYTQQQNKKQNNSTMIIFMVVMTAMMVYFAFTNAGIAFYWVIGNTYQIGQTAISKAIEARKDEKKRLASGKVRGRE